MRILGINDDQADVSAALVSNGQVLAALEEERFNRVKHTTGFPAEAIRGCLRIAGIDGSGVDRIVLNGSPRAHAARRALSGARHPPSPGQAWSRIRDLRRQEDTVADALSEVLSLSREQLPARERVEHHVSHLASAYFASPFEEAAICSMDGVGDFVCTALAHGERGGLRVLDRTYFPHSLGLLYTAVTQYLGFSRPLEEYKVMGLAAHGSPAVVDELGSLVELGEGGGYRLDTSFFANHGRPLDSAADGSPVARRLYGPRLERLLGPARGREDPIEARHEDIAHSLQTVFERAAVHVLRDLWRRTRSRRLCVAGGCFMNSVLNGKILEQTPFEELFVQPAGGDSGTALGAAFSVGSGRRCTMEHAYLGTAHGRPEVDRALQALSASGGDYEVTSLPDRELARLTATLLADGDVIGWFRGRMEFGARALGARSILADPRRPEMPDRLNSTVKAREPFRPFGASVLESELGEYFEGAAPDPFMVQVHRVRPAKRSAIPAVTHVDGSSRPHTVTAGPNTVYHDVIRAFHDRTGVPMVLNTSFNRDEPIVESPKQAVDCFVRGGLDALVLEDTLVRRRTAP